MESILFKDLNSAGHVAICSVLAFFVAFLFIRISGKRTLSKLTAFDFVVTVTLGSTVSSMILGKTVLIDGAIALAIIIGLQFLLAFVAMKSKPMEKIINSSPTLLFYEGHFLEHEMKREVVTKEEIYAAVREYRLLDINEVKAVVMELSGELTVIRKAKSEPAHHSLHDIPEIE